MWIYKQSAGQLYHNDKLIGSGYSGSKNQNGYNNSILQDKHNIGPIPKGNWKFVSAPYNSIHTGNYTLDIESEGNTNTFGRSGFKMHGDSLDNPGYASEGCIIMPYDVRVIVYKSKDLSLLVE